MKTLVYIKKISKNSHEKSEYQHEQAWKLLKTALLENHLYGKIEKTNGKPIYIGREECFISISHTGKRVAAAISDHPVGIDLEEKRIINRKIEKRVLSEEERFWLSNQENYDYAFLQLWTLKESYGKMTGKGLGYPLNETAFCIKEKEITCSISEIKCFQWAGEGILSVCVGTCGGENIETPQILER